MNTSSPAGPTTNNKRGKLSLALGIGGLLLALLIEFSARVLGHDALTFASLRRLVRIIPAPMALVLVFLLAIVCAGTAKPTVPLDESCRNATAVLVVEPAADRGTYRVREVLYDGTTAGLKVDAIISVDLGGLVYEMGRAYILFMKPGAEGMRWRAVPQMRTEDSPETRERVHKLLAAAKAKG